MFEITTRPSKRHVTSFFIIPATIVYPGNITLTLRADAAPKTVAHIAALVSDGLYNGCCFYRSDFVIQCGLQTAAGQNVNNPHPDLPVNETAQAPRVSNTRGTCAVAHWDVPDNGNSEWFINLKTNAHLDEAYGGYCVFAQVADDASFAVVDAIAQAILQGQKPEINSISLA